MNRPDTIVAVATPPGKGAIAIIRVSGPAVPELERRLVGTASPLRARLATRARMLDERGNLLDEGLAIRFIAPHSYTGEDMLELQVHGSPVVAREVVRAWLACGARLAQPGEFTQRAFFNDKMDLHAAAAVADIVNAETAAAARAALANLGGGLADEVRALRATLAETLEALAGAIDFPDEVPEPPPSELAAGLQALHGSLLRLRRDGELGRLVREGLAVAIVGPPNAGKSSLLNALLGMERAIVSEIPGTTRDTIEETILIGGVPIRLVDTAGIRSHADRLERAGIERTRRTLEAASIALVVLDGSQPLSAEARALLAETRDRDRVLFFNKADLGKRGVPESVDKQTIVGSAQTADTLAALRQRIADVGWNSERIDVARPHLTALHEFDAVNAALQSIERAQTALARQEPLDFVATELHHAFSSMGQVSEQTGAEEIIGGIFSRFCIGK